MRGLDNFIMGTHDPSAPFNQVDIAESHWADVLELCDWFTEEMYDDDYEYQLLSEAIGRVETFNLGSVWLNQRSLFNYVKANKLRLADELKVEYQNLKNMPNNFSTLTWDELRKKADEQGLSNHLLTEMVRYLRNIRCMDYSDSCKGRTKVHFKKLTENTFNQYWELLSNNKFNILQ